MMINKTLFLSVVLLVLVLMFLMMAIPVFAVRSVALMPGKIDIAETLRRNEKVYLPAMYVTNNNDFTMNVEMLVVNPKQEELNVDESWIKFKPQHFKLKPSETQKVSISIKVDKYAQNGNYKTWLKAKSKQNTGQMELVPSVATVLTFKIEGGLVLGAAFIGSLQRGYGKVSLWFLANWGILVAILITFSMMTTFSYLRNLKRYERIKKPETDKPRDKVVFGARQEQKK